MRVLSTAECGLAGHPDKVADSIGDAVLDAFLREDPESRVGCQVMLANGVVVVGGQITSRAKVDIPSVVRGVLVGVGYEETWEGMSAQSEIMVRVDPQSPEIAAGVARGGAGDSAIVIGFACRDTPELMPAPTSVVHGIATAIDSQRKMQEAPWLRPDGKIQATIEYLDSKPHHADSFVLSVQHDREVTEIRRDAFLRKTVEKIMSPGLLSDESRFLSRPDVAFSVGGPKADCGLSGRKVISDTYGGFARHGGGGLSGKDPSKIDRCGMYSARYIAKNLVASGITSRCEVELAYMIGYPDPIAISLDCVLENGVSHSRLVEIVRKVFPLTPPAIIERLNLRRPIYEEVGLYGHFGHESDHFRWEECDCIAEVRRLI